MAHLTRQLCNRIHNGNVYNTADLLRETLWNTAASVEALGKSQAGRTFASIIFLFFYVCPLVLSLPLPLSCHIQFIEGERISVYNAEGKGKRPGTQMLRRSVLGSADLIRPSKSRV